MIHARRAARVWATIAIGIGATTAQSARAADWWWIDVSGHTPTRDVVFVDQESIKRTPSGRVDAWEQDYHETAEKPDGAKSSKVLFEYDCSARTYSMISYVDYDASGDMVSSNTIPSYSRSVNPIAPDTIGETELEFVCGDTTKGRHLGPNLNIMSAGPVLLYAMDHPSPDSSTSKP